MTTTAPRKRQPTKPDEVDTPTPRVSRAAIREWVRLGDVRVNPLVQREFVPSKADAMAATFDPENFGLPVVNIRGGHAWMIDGQHRAAALRIWLGDGWEDQLFEAEVYHNLSESEEANTFLKRNDSMAVNAYNKFRIAVVAGHEDEMTVSSIVLRAGLTITKDASSDSRVMAVGTLLRVYRKAGGPVLMRTLEIIRDAYGAAGLEAAVISGMSMVVHRYDDLNDKEMTSRLAAANGGVGGMLAKAERTRRETGNPKHFCVAGSIVDTYNAYASASKGGNGTKLMSWWRATASD